MSNDFKKKLEDVKKLLTLQQCKIPEMSNNLKKKLEDVNVLLTLQQKEILDILYYSILDIERGEKEKLFSKQYETYFSKDDVLGLINHLETTFKNMNYLVFVDKLPEEEKEWKKNNFKQGYDSEKMIELYNKIQQITNQFEWDYDIANNKLYFSLKDGKEIKTDLLTPDGVKKITEMMLQSQESNYIHFINKTFQALNENITKSPTSEQLNTEFKNLLDIILDNDSNSRYNFEFKKVNGLDRIVLDIKDNKNKSNKNNLILEIKEEKVPLTGYSIFIGSLDEQNIRRKDGILFNSDSYVSFIKNKKAESSFHISELLDLLHRDKRNNFSDTIFIMNLKRAINSSELSRK